MQKEKLFDPLELAKLGAWKIFAEFSREIEQK